MSQSQAQQSTTIAAPATAPGQAGIAVIRVSGPASAAVLRKCFSHRGAYEPRRLYHGRVLLGGETADEAMAVYFRAPMSYTGEDMAELHCHGGGETVRAALEALYAAGAVPAEPGEFTKRAFLNGKMDLAQAEAVMDLISAQAEGARRVALGQLEGRLGRAVMPVQELLLNLLAEIEAATDYPEDDVGDASVRRALKVLREASGKLEALLTTARMGRAMREGVRCAIAGRPNTGKSSLLNALLGEDRAIVTAKPGTTRDTLDAAADIQGLPVVFTDTAGIRRARGEAEAMGVARAERAINESGLALLVLDGSAVITQADRDIYARMGDTPCIIAVNKADLTAATTPEDAEKALPCLGAVAVSARTGLGVDALRQRIFESCAGSGALSGSAVLSNLRHIEAVREAADALRAAANALTAGFPTDVASGDIRRAWRALGLVTGKTVDEDVIDLIFSRFCLGK